jgi:hypothetical protein
MEKLTKLIDKSYNYKGKDLVIKKVKKVNGTNVIITTGNSINLLDNEVDDFVDNLLPIKVKEGFFDIQNILIEAIERVRIDKDYIQQANAICNITSQLINIKKLDLKK